MTTQQIYGPSLTELERANALLEKGLTQQPARSGGIRITNMSTTTKAPPMTVQQATEAVVLSVVAMARGEYRHKQVAPSFPSALRMSDYTTEDAYAIDRFKEVWGASPAARSPVAQTAFTPSPTPPAVVAKREIPEVAMSKEAAMEQARMEIDQDPSSKYWSEKKRTNEIAYRAAELDHTWRPAVAKQLASFSAEEFDTPEAKFGWRWATNWNGAQTGPDGRAISKADYIKQELAKDYQTI